MGNVSALRRRCQSPETCPSRRTMSSSRTLPGLGRSSGRFASGQERHIPSTAAVRSRTVLEGEHRISWGSCHLTNVGGPEKRLKPQFPQRLQWFAATVGSFGGTRAPRKQPRKQPPSFTVAPAKDGRKNAMVRSESPCLTSLTVCFLLCAQNRCVSPICTVVFNIKSHVTSGRFLSVFSRSLSAYIHMSRCAVTLFLGGQALLLMVITGCLYMSSSHITRLATPLHFPGTIGGQGEDDAAYTTSGKVLRADCGQEHILQDCMADKTMSYTPPGLPVWPVS